MKVAGAVATCSSTKPRLEADATVGAIDATPSPAPREQVQGAVAQDLEADLGEDPKAGPMDGLDALGVEDLHRAIGIDQGPPRGPGEADRGTTAAPPTALGRHAGKRVVGSVPRERVDAAVTRRAGGRTDGA